MAKEKQVFYGGQAVMEGVMMRGAKDYCIAVRNPKGEIENRSEKIAVSRFTQTLGKVPVLRGIVRLGSSMMVGYKVMTASMEMAGIDEVDGDETPSKFDMWLQRKLGDKLSTVLVVFAVILSLAFSIALFMVLPTWLSGFLAPLLGDNLWALGIVEGLVRLLILITYLLLFSRLKDVKRLFQYHGAEHMVINCHEAGEGLTAANAAKHSRLHKRCGTSFLLFVMLISMIFFLFVRTDEMWLRLLSRVLFVPFIAGVSFEVIRWAGISNSIIVRILSWPGFMLQKITTAVPDEGQLEVAIAAFEGVLEAERAQDAETV
ncbi:MAG: DUF1385 domain-containing protein [Defluviitaleaceae bacterium]|nr:DUF1385 domain-containing protein [Defluviitaleaceae bacterium]